MNWIKKNKYKILIILLWIIIVLVLINTHENWRDEAQGWLIARDLNIFELVSQLKYEGHFILWYLILMPFAKLGLPYNTANIISACICLISVIIIVFKSPFKPYIKLLFIFSYPLLYLYPVISRCYCLIPLGISLVSWFYKTRYEKPIRYILSIILLTNTHIIMLGFIFILVVDYIYGYIKKYKNNKKILICIIVLIISIILSCIPVLGAVTANKVESSYKVLSTSMNILDLIKNSDNMLIIIILPILYYLYLFIKKPNLNKNYHIILLVTSAFCISLNIIYSINIYITYSFEMVILLILLTIFLYILSKKYTDIYLKMIFSIIFVSLISLLIFKSSLQRIYSCTFILMFYFWNSQINKEKKVNILFVLLMLISLMEGTNAMYKDIKYDYSSAYKAGEYINESTSSDAIFIVGCHPEAASAIIPYVKNNQLFYNLATNLYFTFVTWDEGSNMKVSDDYDIYELTNYFEDVDNLYYIYSSYFINDSINDSVFVDKMIEEGIFEEVYTTNSYTILEIESYTIYKINMEVS